MIDTLSEAGSWERAIRGGRIPITDYAPTPIHYPADQRGEGRVRGGFQTTHNGSLPHD